MKVVCRAASVPLAIPFTIYRGTTAVQRVAIAEIEHRGVTGYGEASPSAYYGDSIEAAEAAIRASQAVLTGPGIGGDPFALEAISRRLRQEFPLSHQHSKETRR